MRAQDRNVCRVCFMKNVFPARNSAIRESDNKNRPFLIFRWTGRRARGVSDTNNPRAHFESSFPVMRRKVHV